MMHFSLFFHTTRDKYLLAPLATDRLLVLLRQASSCITIPLSSVHTETDVQRRHHRHRKLRNIKIHTRFWPYFPIRLLS